MRPMVLLPTPIGPIKKMLFGLSISESVLQPDYCHIALLALALADEGVALYTLLTNKITADWPMSAGNDAELGLARIDLCDNAWSYEY